MSQSVRAFIGGSAAAGLVALIVLTGSSASPRALGFQGAPTEAPRTAVVDVLAVTEKVFASDRFEPARSAMRKQKEDELAAMDSGLREMVAKWQGMAENAPDREPLRTAIQNKQQEAQQAGQKARGEFDTFTLQQFTEAYKLAVETANGLAKKSGFDHVLASRTGPLTFRSSDVTAALQEVLARPVLLCPESDDLTPAVMKELHVENVNPGADQEEKKDGGAKPDDKK